MDKTALLLLLLLTSVVAVGVGVLPPETMAVLVDARCRPSRRQSSTFYWSSLFWIVKSFSAHT